MQKCKCDERFGQDASIRASSGWLAGPKGVYGYDPIDQFARQIEEMKARKAVDARRDLTSDDPRLVMMTDYPNLEDSPTKDIGPSFREGHYPFVLEELQNSSEGFEYNKEKLCRSCMTTEELDAL
uniref:Uncharacterized protein n=1 Tax=Marseillevirus LCMAC102 TaxID=2506603 RepID=A0A481YST4_9VIRU|nr:MAG: hypothetical protein LCMAC102_00970 [Marseillevirus LCMAC102]